MRFGAVRMQVAVGTAKPCEPMHAIQGMVSEAEEMAGRKLPYSLLAPQLRHCLGKLQKSW